MNRSIRTLSLKLKDRFKEIFIDNGIASDEYLDILAVVLSFDKGLAESNNIDNMSDYFDILNNLAHQIYELPYHVLIGLYYLIIPCILYRVEK